METDWYPRAYHQGGEVIYLIGSLKTTRARDVAVELRNYGHEVFDEWNATSRDADKHWEDYERISRKRNFREALEGKAACNSFDFDYRHLLMCDAAVLAAPAGRSAHLELGFILGKNKPGFILLDGEPVEFDLMYKLATAIFYNVDELVEELKKRRL
jgi:hypothetical protein